MKMLFGSAAALMIASAPLAVTFAQTSTNIPGAAEELVIEPRQKRAQSPDGDPRSVGEMREHRTAFDQCVVTAPEHDMAHPVDSTPEEYCSRVLGMADRDAVPNFIKQPLNSEDR
jgi:hypothetical protein